MFFYEFYDLYKRRTKKYNSAYRKINIKNSFIFDDLYISHLTFIKVIKI